MFEGFKEHLVSGEVDVHARVGGHGPALLLLHGFPQNLFEWARVAPLLAERYTVVCTDLRGYGKSGKPPAEGDAYSFRSMARDQVLRGSAGVLAQRFDVRSVWAKRLAQPEFATVNGGHFFVDQLPVQTAEILGRFLDKNSRGGSPAAPSGVPAREAGS